MFIFVTFVIEGIITKVTLVRPHFLMNLLNMSSQRMPMMCFKTTGITNMNLSLHVNIFDMPCAQEFGLEDFPANVTFMLIDPIMLVIVHFETSWIKEGLCTSQTLIFPFFGMSSVEMTF